MSASRVFRLRPECAGQVRAFVTANARLDSMRQMEAALLVTEVVANSLRHGESDWVEVSVINQERTVRVTVTEDAQGPLDKPSPGLGFKLLEALSQSWGTEHDDSKLTFWFTVRSPGAVSVVPENLTDEELLSRVHDDPYSREELVRRYQPIASSIARRYRGKGISDEDLHQVALIALMKAIHRYDATRGELRSFAAVTISGELKRQLRDQGWSVHVPRGLQERAIAVGSAIDRMTQVSGRVPRISELAEALHLEEEDVAEAISVAHGYRAISLDSDRDDQIAPMELLGEVDASLAATATRTSVQEALTSLPERERLIVYLRFFEDMTQSQIAEAMGISQMHVSRLLSKSMDELGALLTVGD